MSFWIIRKSWISLYQFLVAPANTVISAKDVPNLIYPPPHPLSGECVNGFGNMLFFAEIRVRIESHLVGEWAWPQFRLDLPEIMGTHPPFSMEPHPRPNRG